MVQLARGFDPRVDVRLTEAAHPAPAMMDRELIEQALLDLIKNAAEATRGHGQPAVTLKCHREDDALVLTVEDNGHGLPVNAEDIFLPFYPTKAEGAGIGLAVARQIVMAHGGSLTAERLTEGTRFSIHLPTG